MTLREEITFADLDACFDEDNEERGWPAWVEYVGPTGEVIRGIFDEDETSIPPGGGPTRVDSVRFDVGPYVIYIEREEFEVSESKMFAVEQAEPVADGWFIDYEDGEAWLKDDKGWRLLDGYGSGGGFEEDNWRTWDEVKMYGPFRRASEEEVQRETRASNIFMSARLVSDFNAVEQPEEED